jgi:hypothetical protein
MLKDQSFDASKIMSTHSPVTGKHDCWDQPKLAFPVRSPHMDVSRFMAFIREKVKSETSDAA